MGNIFDPNGPGSDLMNFGFASMAAGGQPGATTLGALGEGGMGMNQAALQRAQTQLLSQQGQHTNLENQLVPYQMALMQAQARLYRRAAGDKPGNNGAGFNPSPAVGGSVSTTTREEPTRNNNPGNLRPPGSSTGFQSFASTDDGIGALKNDLLAKVTGKSNVMQGKKPTLFNVVSVYAPEGDNNDPQAYTQFISDKTGIKPFQRLNADDVDKIIPAIVQYEGASTVNPGTNNSIQNSEQTSNIPAVPGMTSEQSARSFLGDKGVVAEYEAQTAPYKAAAVKAAELPYAAKAKEEEATGTDTAAAKKTYASISSRIDNAKKIIGQMKTLSSQMPNRGPFDTEVWASKHLGNQKLESAVKSFENLNENLFTQELPGVIPPGSRLDIPIVNALQKASKVDPHASHQARLTVLTNLEGVLDNAKQNAAKNYGILSGTDIPGSSQSPVAQSVTHKWTPNGIVPIGTP